MIAPSAYIHESAIVEDGAHLGDHSKVWHFSHVMPGARIGANCSLGQNSYVASTVALGNGVKVQNNVSLYDGVVCEDDVFIGPSCVFTNVRNPRSAVNRRDAFEPTVVQQGATLGANATIRCGVTIGRHAFVGAGAVVVDDVPAYALMLGVPAKQAGWMSEHGEALEFNSSGVATCPATGTSYHLVNGCIQPSTTSPS